MQHPFWRAREQRSTPLRKGLALAASAALVSTAAVFAPSAFAAHYESSLEGSTFQVDTDANLTVEPDAEATKDWMNVEQNYQEDKINGTGDDSYSGGSKEDTVCPKPTTDSIPPNKSDLVQFGVWEEKGSPGFLNMYWVRVTEPTGTTLMDFEFNQSTTACANGSPNVERTAGDLLIEYAIDNGGSRADMTLRTWTGSAWGAPSDIDADAMAAGTINSSPIAQMDTLAQDQSARTFGEASVDLSVIFDDTKCTSFGSAMLKSRSSDSFTSQLKDFVAPVPISLTNCGGVEITKQTLPDGDTTDFAFTKSFGTSPTSANTFKLADDGTKSFTGVLFGSGFTVSENTVPTGYEFVSIDCSASTGNPTFTVDNDTQTVTFDILEPDDFLKCTFNNRALADLTIVKEVKDASGGQKFSFTEDVTTAGTGFDLTPTAVGAAGAAEKKFSGIATGTYSVAEDVPTGWNLASATCDNGDAPGSVSLSAGDDVTCTFVNEKERGAIDITKTRKHAAATNGTGPHAGVKFTVTNADGFSKEVTTDAQGTACVSGLLYGTYTVTETVPTGYVSDDAAQDVTVDTEANCTSGVADAEDVAFVNTPLTDVTVSVDSQVDGGTASTISCVDDDGATVKADLSNDPGDVSIEMKDLEPTAPVNTLVCTIVIDP